MTVILASSAGLVATRPVLAQLCATITTYQNGVPQTTTHCEPLLDDFPPRCVDRGDTVGGNGADVSVCVPSPVAQLQ